MSIYSNNEAIRSFVDSKRYKYHVDNNGVYTLTMGSDARMNASVITLCAEEDHVIVEAACPVTCPVERMEKLRSFAAYANWGMNCGHFGVEEICDPDSGRVTGGMLKFGIAAESFGENPDPHAVYEAMGLAVITLERYADGAADIMFGRETDPEKCAKDCERDSIRQILSDMEEDDDEDGYDDDEEDEDDDDDDDGDSEGTDAVPEDESDALSDEDAEDDDVSALRRELQELFGELVDEDEIDESDMSLNDLRVLEALRKLLACGEEKDEARMTARICEAVTGLEALLSELSEEEGEKYGDLHESVLDLMESIAEADSGEPDCDEADDADEAEDDAEDSSEPGDEQTKSMFAQLMDMLTEEETGVDPLIPVRARMNACFVRREDANEYLFSIHAARSSLKRLKELEARFDEARSELEETAEEAKACVKCESDADELCAEISGRLRLTTRLLRIIRKYLRGIELRGSEDLWDEDDLPVSAPDGDGESGEDTWDEDDLATSEPDGCGDSCDDAWDED